MPLLPFNVRDQVLADLTHASKDEALAGAFRVAVAQNLLEFLRPATRMPPDPQAVRALDSGELFLFDGPIGAKGFSVDPETVDSHVRGRLQIPSRGTDLLLSEPRLSHSLTLSIGTFQEQRGSRFVLAIRGPGPSNFETLMLGVSIQALKRTTALRYGQLRPMQPTEFVAHVVDGFQEQIETRNTWKLLHKQGSTQPSRESSIQHLFEAFCFMNAGDLDISVDPESNHGAGNLDVCVSRGAEAVCIELKRAGHKRLVHGLESQLPEYMRAKKSKVGWFVVVAQEVNEDPVEILRRLEDVVLPHDLNIQIRVVDARPRATASV